MLNRASTYTGRVIESMGKTWKVYHEPNGWYAETDGDLCLGPFDSEDELGQAVWRDRRALTHDGPSIGPDVPGGGAI